ncbi:aldo/keto reductase, partial [Flagellimonas flava]|uniref:aldo/keto reductase n=1 Tax=Flagellimonas flava TaxID=570519 RepID=UPI003D64E290
YLVQQDLVNFCKSKGIQYEAWSPIMQGNIFDMPILKQMAEKYGRTVAQVVLRWDLQKGVVTIPKCTKPERIVSNADLFDFEHSTEDVHVLDNHDRGQRFGPDPNNFDF